MGRATTLERREPINEATVAQNDAGAPGRRSSTFNINYAPGSLAGCPIILCNSYKDSAYRGAPAGHPRVAAMPISFGGALASGAPGELGPS